MAMPKYSPPSASESESFDDIPMDSMLRLNDNCLWNIFKMLDIETLCRMADVCKHFRLVAEDVFRLCRSDIYFDKDYNMNLRRRILRQFGHLITMIDDETNLNVDAISQYCRPNLNHLTLREVTINCDLMEPVFGQLKCLNLGECNFI